MQLTGVDLHAPHNWAPVLQDEFDIWKSKCKCIRNIVNKISSKRHAFSSATGFQLNRWIYFDQCYHYQALKHSLDTNSLVWHNNACIDTKCIVRNNIAQFTPGILMKTTAVPIFPPLIYVGSSHIWIIRVCIHTVYDTEGSVPKSWTRSLNIYWEIGHWNFAMMRTTGNGDEDYWLCCRGPNEDYCCGLG